MKYCISVLLVGIVFVVIPARAQSLFSGGSADLRSYFFQRDFKDGRTDWEAFSVGGVLKGLLHPSEQINLGMSLYTSQGLGLNDDSKDVYSLLATDSAGDHKGYTSLGEAYIQAHYNSWIFRLGRQEIKTPWLNTHDVRMTPHSFDAVLLKWNVDQNSSIQLCHAVEMKTRTEKKSRPMSEVAGAGGDKGVSCLGYEQEGELSVQLWGYRVHELWDDLYMRLDYKPEGDNWYIVGRYLIRESSGKQLVGIQDSWHGGITAGHKTQYFEYALSLSDTGNHTIRYHWGHATAIANQVMVANRAEEQAIKLAVRFWPVVFPGVSFGLSYSLHDTPDSGGNQSVDLEEYNIDFKYILNEWLPGASLRLRHAYVNEDGLGEQDHTDSRMYLRYQFDLK
ncbi:MAG: OprD family outer membrane porin [Candidatus Thiodiazotropha taylori]